MSKIIIIIFLSLLLQSAELFAENQETEKSSGFMFLPIIGYAPETSVEFGLSTNYYFREPSSAVNSRPSSIAPMLTYTTNKQILAELTTDLYLQNELIHFYSEARYYKYPDLFYGIGNDVDLDREENYIPIRTELFMSIQYKLVNRLNIGGQYEYRKLHISEYELDGLLANGSIAGSGGSISSGAGFLFNYDTRDNIFQTFSGGFYQVSSIFFDPVLGSDNSFSIWEIDLRYFFSLRPNHILALQAKTDLSYGSLPFNMLPELGSDSILRGYHQSIYRDKIRWAYQVEYRFPVYKNWSAVAFTGIGDVNSSLQNVDLLAGKYSLGTGVRYLLVPEEQMTIRFDFAIGTGTSGFYINLLEAF